MLKFEAVVEIPAGSKYKYEMCKDTGMLLLDRVIDIAYPSNYGYLAGTLAEDKDPIDCFIVTEQPLVPLARLNVQILGQLLCYDNAIPDDKLICMLVDESLNDVELDHKINEIKLFLSSYKRGFEVVDEEFNPLVIFQYIKDRTLPNDKNLQSL